MVITILRCAYSASPINHNQMALGQYNVLFNQIGFERVFTIFLFQTTITVTPKGNFSLLYSTSVPITPSSLSLSLTLMSTSLSFSS